MNIRTRLDLWELRLKNRKRISSKKASDYADPETDANADMKRMAELCKIFNIDVRTPEGNAMYFVVKKLDRLANLLNMKDPENESLFDTIAIDMPNYLDMLVDLLVESGKIKLNVSKDIINNYEFADEETKNIIKSWL